MSDQFEPAYRTLVVACKSDKRWFDLDAVREPYKGNHKMGEAIGGKGAEYGDDVRSAWTNRSDVFREDRGGAPPLDYWLLDTQDGVDRVLKSMLPEKVCRVCGEPSRRITSEQPQATTQEAIAALIEDRRTALGITRADMVPWFIDRYKNAESVKAQVSNWERAKNVPSFDDWETLKDRLGISDEFDGVIAGERSWTEEAADYEPVSGDRVVTAVLPEGVNPAGRGFTHHEAVKHRRALGWTDCDHNDWRAGVVLDPFDLTTREPEVGQARYIIADVFEALESLPDNSVDLVFSSPPFLALRSYLPADHPNKAKEIGSEATPADFLDTLLDVVEACDRVLAPHGSLCFELGDSFSGSGGSGGDYADDGWRKGQPRFGGSAAKARESKWSLAQATWLAGVIDTEGSIIVRRQDRGEGQAPSYRAAVQVQMMDPEVVDRCIEITGVGHHGISDKGVYRWHATAQQARYILLNIWPHLLIKQKQAWAAIELMRHMEESERRGKHARVNDEQLAYRDGIRDYVCGLNRRGEERGTFVPMWEPPMPPRIDHSGFSDLDETGWPMPKSLCGLPSLFAASLAYGYNMLRPERRTPPWRIRNLIAWCRPNPPVGALGDKFRPATSYLTVACKSDRRWFDLDSVRDGNYQPRTSMGKVDSRDTARAEVGLSSGMPGKDNNPAGAPPLDYWEIPTHPFPGSHYATFPPALCIKPIKSMTPKRVCRVCGEPSRRITEPTAEYANRPNAGDFLGTEHDRGKGMAARTERRPGSDPSRNGVQNVTLGWTDCECACICDDSSSFDVVAKCPVQHSLGFTSKWRNGVVLDPFAGSGTTLAVATGHGRDAIGIDLDESNAKLALERVGPLFLEVINGRTGDPITG